MRQRSSVCNPEGLRRLLDGGVPESLRAELIGHLDECEACRHALEGMAGGERWWWDARRFVGMEAEARPAGGDGHRGETIPVGTAIETPVDRGEVLGFLSPSGTPGSLGSLGPYEVLGVLGRGGMGLVLRGHDPALNRPVAIKVLDPGAGHGALAGRRFAREARAAAAVVHEHVVAIHAVDEAGGRPYLVMQYVAGRSLQERIDRDGPLRVEEVLRIGKQAAEGLAAAHAQGLVHRDVKPANILLENGVERVKLTDFGLARAVDDSGLTHTGVVAGTPQYMSPEQARGEPVDHRSDLFSLGSVLYAMCTGRSPFRADSTPAVLRRICDDRPRAIRRINPEVPEWLEAVVVRLHAKDPADRFQSAAEVAEVLGSLLARLQALEMPASTSMPGIVPVQGRGRLRRRAGLAILILLAASGVAGVAGLAWALIGAARVGGAGGAEVPEGRPNPAAPEPDLAEAEQPSTFGPPRTITGVVRDRGTGDPIPGVRLSLAGQPGEATSDPAGRYELRGPAASPPAGGEAAGRYILAVAPPPPYLALNVTVASPEGDDPIPADVRVARGIPFRLRLTDRATGRPVREARVVYRPLHPNPAVGDALTPGASGPHSRAVEGPDGAYAGALLPGPGAIAVESYADHYGPASVDPVAFFVPGTTAPRGIDAATVYGNRQLLAVETGGGYGVYYWPQGGMSAVLLVDPRPGRGPIELQLDLRNNRTGAAAR